MSQQALINILDNVLSKDDDRTLSLHEPLFEGNEWEYVKDTLDTGWVSYAGTYVTKFEGLLAEKCQVKHAISVVSGTAALHMALLLSDVQRDQEILVPSLTFVASANAVSYCGAIPHFIECSRATLGVDPEKLRDYLADISERKPDGTYNKSTGRRIAAIIPVHVFGHPVDMDPLLELARDYDIRVIEDAAESLGSLYKGHACGSISDIAALSFNGNKIVTTGGGGAILTNNDELARKARHLTTTAKQPHKWAFEHDAIGYNYRMPALNAALGCAQLEKLDEFVKAKRHLADLYEHECKEHNNIAFCKEPEGTQSNYWLNAVLIDGISNTERDKILQSLHDRGYLCRPVWKPMHQLAMFKTCPSMELSVTEQLSEQLINLPSSVGLGK